MASTAPHPKPQQGFRLRPFITGLAASAFLALFVSGAILFVAPSGRVSRELDWTLLGISRGGWEEIHVAFTVLFVVVMGFHLTINWLGFRTDMLGRSKRHPALRAEFLVALLLAALLVAAAALDLPPARQLMAAHEYLRETLWDGAGTGHEDGLSSEPHAPGAGRGQGGGQRMGRNRSTE